MILLINGDRKIAATYRLTFVETERQVAERSILIKNMLEDLGDSGEAIPIPNVINPPRFPRLSECCQGVALSILYRLTKPW